MGLVNIAPAGAITSNVIDLSQWLRLMLGRGVLDGKRIVSEKGFGEIVKRHIAVDEGFGVPPYLSGVGYGLGWFLAERDGHHFIYHPGGLNGFTALVELVPDQNLGLVVLTNVSSNSTVAAISDIIFGNIVGKPQTRAEDTAPAPPQSEPAGPAPSAKIDITVEELMAKVIAAAGGEANTRKHRSTTGTATLDFENQGLTGKLTIYAQAPNSATQITTIMGVARRLSPSVSTSMERRAVSSTATGKAKNTKTNSWNRPASVLTITSS
jgi:hypothetical protein